MAPFFGLLLDAGFPQPSTTKGHPLRGWLHAFWRKGLLILSLLLCSSYVHAQGAPTVAGVGPNSGSTTGGDSVILTGTNFTGATAVRFGEKSATGFSVNNATTIRATTPTHAAGAVTVEVTTPGGSAALTNAYTYVLPAPTVGPVSATVAANSSSNPITLSLSGGAATSVAISTAAAHGTATASGTTISYTPTAGYSGSDTLAYTATNASGTSSPATVSITVSAPSITLSPGSLSNGIVGVTYNSSFSASGGTAPYSYNITSGSMPAGLSLSPSGTLSGTPTTGGAYNFSIGVQDRYGATGSQTYSLTVSAPSITLSPGSLSNGTVGTPYSATLSSTGGTAPYSYSITSGSLPTGLSLNTGTGAISGIPSVAGAYNLTITATDTNSATGSQAYSITIGGQVPVSTAVIAVVPANSSLNPITLNISGGAATSVAVASAASHGTATASGTSISYTPAAGFSGVDSFTYTATNASGTSSPATVSITVSAPTLTITPTTLPNGTQSTAYSQTLTTSAGTAPYSYRITSGNLPAGLSLNTSSGVFSGTPTAGGAFNLTITVTDANGATGSQPYSLQVQAQSVVVPPSNQTVAAGQTASVDLTQGATGGPFTSATLLSVSPPSAGTARMTGPFTMSFAPAAAFSGSAVVSFNLQAASGSVGNGFVTFAVQSRPDPTTDATVRGVTTSQQQAAVRFAGTQLMNFTQRLEHLRNPQRSTFTSGLQLAMPRAVNTQVRNCRSATSLLEQQECVSSQGRMERGSLAPGWSRAAQHNAAAAAQGMNTEQAFASRPQPLGQDVPLSEVGSASGTQRSVTASQQFMGKIAPEHAQMTALPAADTPIAEPGSAARPRLAYWTSGMVDWGFAEATAGQDDGLRFTTSGVTMGMDYLLSKEWTVGMGIGFAYDRTKIGSEGSRNHSKGVSTALYGSWNPAPAYFVDGVLGYSRMSFDTRRWVADAGEFAQGERDGSQWFAALSAGYEWRTEEWMLSPYGRLQFARSSLDAYTETGAGWHALRFDKQNITNTSASLGLRGEISHDTRWGTLLPFGRLELQHDFDHQSNMRLGYADLAGSSQSYSISSTALGRNRVQLGFGSRLQSRVGTFAAEMQFTRSSHSFQRGLRLMYTTRW
ncbi:autotransporter domain-containing protein [Comamonas sp. CMM02]|nr:autotransporter domain-containing protein [Comamonas sp. CMM02]